MDHLQTVAYASTAVYLFASRTATALKRKQQIANNSLFRSLSPNDSKYCNDDELCPSAPISSLAQAHAAYSIDLIPYGGAYSTVLEGC